MPPSRTTPLPALSQLSLSLLLLLLLLSAPRPTAASTATTTTSPAAPTPTVLDVSDRYRYAGCYNETTAVSGAGGARALGDGADEVLAGQMTVPLCLGFCAGGGGGGTVYKYAGLEFSRECWCAQRLSAASAKLSDSECNLGCDGDSQTACGGALKLTVYMLSAAPSTNMARGLAAIIMMASVVYNLL
ncbi:WSC domain-containing protein 2 [Phialemonium atrogriseum]|uniref:WSC domain-containing protein 2 n=1 Tax=Phialemonium atrogriseum TaxID=1093897 RepID=A0AAJ0C4X0_9PEZI|nr:WSC domain-containing protein 2 [Phialemonium atrogriseum]KAK1769562.1 WSC domain-containing protein 2 [Phialemonium atrogriseum]